MNLSGQKTELTMARYSLTPEEVEEACFGGAFVQQAKSQGKHPVAYVLSQTVADRYVFCGVSQSKKNGMFGSVRGAR